MTGSGTILVTWTSSLGGTRFGVKAARLTSTGLQPAQLSTDDTANASLDDAAVGPNGQAAIVWTQSDTANPLVTVAYAALSTGPGIPFGPGELINPPNTTGAGPTVAFQPVTGEPVVLLGLQEKDNTRATVSLIRTSGG